VGTVKLHRLPTPARRIICGDSNQNWLGMTAKEPAAPIELRLDFQRTSVPVYVVGWYAAHPTRHGGENPDCYRLSGRAGRARANYLFADGHASTLDYLQARRTMQRP
jgi:prepilin-type processing-associated H-X9-DG protein